MNNSLEGVRAKFDRAQKHATEAKAICDNLAAEASLSVNSTLSENSSVMTLTFNSDIRIPNTLRTIIGDCLFNMRSAYDHLAWQLVLVSGGTPNKKTQFPIMENAIDFERSSVTLLPVQSNAIRNAVESCQPYANTYGYENDQLWLVNKLCNIDKHRLPLLTAMATDMSSTYWGLPEGVTSPSVKIFRHPLSRGAQIASFDFGGFEVPKDFAPHVPVIVVICEMLHHWSYAQQAGSLLESLSQILKNQVNRFFLDFFPGEVPL